MGAKRDRRHHRSDRWRSTEVTGTRTRLAALVLLALATLSGCGGLHPGVAAEVGDQSITDAEVDQLAQEVCTAIQSQPGATAAARSTWLQFVVQGFVLRAVADQLADDYGVTSTERHNAVVEQTKQGIAQIPKLDPDIQSHILDTATSPDYFQDILTLVGAKDLAASGGARPSSDDSIQRGIALAAEWAADNGIEIDPRFPDITFDPEKGVSYTPDETAFVVSDLAKQASDEMAKQQTSTEPPDPEWVGSLPPSQKCG
jgi:hypothetical protein